MISDSLSLWKISIFYLVCIWKMIASDVIINLFLENQKNNRKSIYLEDVIRALEKVKHGGLKKATLRIEIVFVWVVNGYLMLFFVSSFWSRDGKLEAFISAKRAHLSKSVFLGCILQRFGYKIFCKIARHILLHNAV